MSYLNFQDGLLKKISLIIIIGSIIMGFAFTVAQAQELKNIDKEVHLHMFYGQGCPHCSRLQSFLDELQKKYPSLIVYQHEVYQDTVGRTLFEKMSQDYNETIEGVPTVFLDNQVIKGYSNEIGEKIKLEVIRCLKERCRDPISGQSASSAQIIIENNNISDSPFGQKFNNTLTIPIVITAAIVDAINPCAFAVLIILMTAALSIANKKKALKFGLSFTASIYISYFLMGLGLFSALQVTGLSHGFYIIVTVLAVIIGLFNIKDYFWYGKGFLMEVPLSWRPVMKRILRSATTPFGAFLVGFVVSLFELPCTGGPYIVILGLLAKEVTKSIGVVYLLLYNLVFVSPLIILTLIIYKGLSTTSKLESIRQKKLRLLHLIAGILMLIIATVMVLSLVKGWV